MRFILATLILSFALLGIVFSALNNQTITFDFYFTAVQLPKGAALLGALLTGWVVGGLVLYLGLVLRLQHRLRRLAANQHKAHNAAAPVSQNHA